MSRISGRVIRQPLRYTLLGESFSRIPDELDTDLCNYDESLKDKNADLWQKAMKSEMQSMYFNQVWDLMDLSKYLDLGILALIKPLNLMVLIKCLDESRVYKKCDGSVVVFLVLYVNDILLIGNDVGVLSPVKVWLSSQFDMKDLGEASHILGIKLLRDRKQECWAYHKLLILIRF